jgi:hypothetical protein
LAAGVRRVVRGDLHVAGYQGHALLTFAFPFPGPLPLLCPSLCSLPCSLPRLCLLPFPSTPSHASRSVDWRFVERDVPGEEDPAVGLGLEAIGFLAVLVVAVAEEDAVDRLGLMLFMCPVVDVCLRSERPEVMERWLRPVIGLVRRLAVVGGRREAVDEVRRCVECFRPVASSF